MNEVFKAILKRAELPDADLYGSDEVARWPRGVLDGLSTMGMLREAEPTERILCDECDEGCWIKPVIRKDPRTGLAVGTYFCRRNDDVGRFAVDLSRRRRWAFIFAGMATVVAKAVKAAGRPVELNPGRLAFLGMAKVNGKTREVFLARGATWPDAAQVFGDCSRLKMASHPAVLTLAEMPKVPLLAGRELAVRPLAEIAGVGKDGLKVPLDGAFPETEPGPWAGIPDEPVTLDQFMLKFCEEHKGTYIAARRKALLAADRNKSLKLPHHVEPWASGQAKKYLTHALLDAWQSYVDRSVVPPLRTQYRTGVLG